MRPGGRSRTVVGVRALATRVRSIDPAVVDALVAVALAVIGVAIFANVHPEPPQRSAEPIAYLLLLVATLSIAWRRRAPFAVLLVSTVAVVILPLPGSRRAARRSRC